MKLILCLLLTFNAFAIEVIPVKQGEPSPADGFFVDKKNMQKFRQINEKKENLDKQVITLKMLAVEKDRNISLLEEESAQYRKRMQWEQTKGNLKTIGGFVLGILATSVAAYAAIRSTK